MRYIILLAWFLWLTLSFQPVHAQDGALKKANQQYDEFSFPEAAEAYKKILAKSDVAEAKIKLADCYRLMNMPVEAEYWFEQVVALAESEPIHKYYYGMALKANGKFEEAKQSFMEYAQLVPADTRGLRQVEACDQANYFLTDPGIYKVVIAQNINSELAEFGPAWYKEGIIFSSEKNTKSKKVYNWTGDPFLDLFYTKSSDGNPANCEAPTIFGGKLNTWVHEGTLSFTSDFGTMYFTRDNYFKGKIGYDMDDKLKTVKLQVYETKVKGDTGDEWGDLVSLPFNSDNYSVGHPTLSADGQALYFVSDMPGGYGGTDLYVAYKSGESWGNPENLGPELNTEGNEMFPYISKDGILYFASDALPGLGGLDIFSAQLQEDGTWSAPENLRYPINTNGDDFAFIIDEKNETGYFTSNRPGGSGDDDIYTFKKLTTIMSGIVVHCKTQEPISGATVELKEGKVIMQKKKTNENGVFNFPVSTGKNYTVIANKEGFEEGTQTVSTVGSDGSNVNVKIPICPKGSKDPCEVRGMVFEKDTKKPVSGAIVKLTNVDTKEDKTFVTADDGSFTFEIEPNSDFVVHATKEYYFTESKTVSTKGIDCSNPQEKNLNLDIGLGKISGTPNSVGNGTDNPNGNTSGPVQLTNPIIIHDNPNITTTGINLPSWLLDDPIKHIYYDFDKDFIRKDASIELNKVVRLMYETPGLIIELRSHTDSRATNEYNMDLSERRARSAVNYIVSKGIAQERITAKGYGETTLFNECSDGVKCSEAKHQENRRTEFAITGYDATAKYSLPRYFGKWDLGDREEFIKRTRRNYDVKNAGTSGSINFNDSNSSFGYNDLGIGTSSTSSYSSGSSYSGGSSGSTSSSSSYSSNSGYSGGSETSTANSSTTTYDAPTYYDNVSTSGSSSKSSGCCATSAFSLGSATSSVDGVEYKIQIGATKNPNLSKYGKLSDLGIVTTEDTGNGTDRILVGTFFDSATAESALTQIKARGIKDAFLVKYQNGLRVGR